MRKIAVCGNRRQDESLPHVNTLLQEILRLGYICVIADGFASYLENHDISLLGIERVDLLPEDTDLVVSIGGDGTFLHAAAWAEGRQIPVMGINTGHLGYLAMFSFEDMNLVKRALMGEICVSERMTLHVDCEALPLEMWPCVLNEVAVLKGDTTSMVNVKAYVDNIFLAEYLADGLVVSTPTGSTAYNLSCGGPILQPTVSNVVLTPIAPHSLTFRPLVIGGDSEVRLEISSRGSRNHVALDGRLFVIPGEGATLIIRKGDTRVSVAQPAGMDFATTLRTKLAWGARN